MKLNHLRAFCYTTDPNKRWEFCDCEDHLKCGTVTKRIGNEYDKFDENGAQISSEPGLRTRSLNRIYDGKHAHLGELPWQAILLFEGSPAPRCGGTIISETVRY